ncbi:bifunctional adenosylcobinamide kinase/adenosylcobinamide-phosphate guanylyltransferase [Paenibacillus sp. BSR1-1]|uniref:bifunctional adenosylcobinamide kinase/adenosylcobinamide-phosphate guanylyltransferase n=1 Tax=Paenibacillus sp. BSR1-1 TaxID=3020845 RepID=UPI0025AF0DBA|nr:bifunctional adenosylcobinamide kinase/adenosylcobinamide-phosphate guanylyltransferase [Paenibacillus sp. BSR1-1]MDN3015268.1 bifunctional adenosylcobinamide kinase/adenosylcobinamide-phosphate guanylyltransferase [Paenibacillus sp. BSR1-1]
MEKVSSLIFITGGVRSGKSSFAERVAVDMAESCGGKLHYLATGVQSDDEMRKRIVKHQQDRAGGKHHWITVEQSVQIGKLGKYFTDRDIILLDCVTTLLNNELFISEREWDKSFLKKVTENIITGIMDIKSRAKKTIVVSNEVLNVPVDGNKLVFIYGKILGHIHQQLVKEADQAYLVEAGIPILMKGVKG